MTRSVSVPKIDEKDPVRQNTAIRQLAERVLQMNEFTALTDGATITPDFRTSDNYSVTLAGNRTLANPININVGQSGVIMIQQDATGSRTLAYGSYWKWPAATAPTLTTTANKIDVLKYRVLSDTMIMGELIKNVG